MEAAAGELAVDTVKHKHEVESMMESEDYEYSNTSPVMYFLQQGSASQSPITLQTVPPLGYCVFKYPRL